MVETRTYKGTTYENGEIPQRFLRVLSGSPDAELREDAAASWNRLVIDVENQTGLTLAVRGWNRTIAEQEEFFFERYRAQKTGGIDARWYKGTRYVRTGAFPAAIPGTSNHGWATTVDVEDFGTGAGNDRFHAARPIMEKHGWTFAEGLSISEPWHTVYSPPSDQYKGKVPPMDPELAEMIRDIHAFLFVKTFKDGKGATTLENILERDLDVARRTLTEVTKDPTPTPVQK